jgi:hypothetical protein
MMGGGKKSKSKLRETNSFFEKKYFYLFCQGGN